MKTIEVMYSCDKCGIHNQKLRVAARMPGQDIKEWMDAVGMRLGEHHFQTSPHCRVTTLTCLKIPIPKKEGFSIGEAEE